MSSLFISSSRVRTNLIVVLVSVMLFLAVDHFLFYQKGFYRLFGEATQEGQILSKLRRAKNGWAKEADVVILGSSYVRSGISSAPFREHSLLPLNLGIGGAGPVFGAYVLEYLEPEFKRREKKPVIIIEIKYEALAKTSQPHWSEYQQYLGVVRDRWSSIADFPDLIRNFSSYGMTSQYIRSLIIPSSLYRADVSRLYVQGWSGLQGYFYGMEDFGGFSPLYSINTKPDLNAPPSPAIPLDGYQPSKLRYLSRQIAVAHRLGSRVVLFSSPTMSLGADSALYDDLYGDLLKEFPDLTILRSGQFDLQASDFDTGGHLNIWGSEKFSRFLIKSLGLSGDRNQFEEKFARAFDSPAIPPLEAWSRAKRIRIIQGSFTLGGQKGDDPVVASIRGVKVKPGREYVLEIQHRLEKGRISIKVEWVNRLGEVHSKSTVTYSGLHPGLETRLYLRFVPRSRFVKLSIVDYGLQTSGEASRGELKIVSLLGER